MHYYHNDDDDDDCDDDVVYLFCVLLTYNLYRQHQQPMTILNDLVVIFVCNTNTDENADETHRTHNTVPPDLHMNSENC